MHVFVGLLRAVNVGGAGKLPMADLRKLCEKAGLRNVQTYIQSGNIVFKTSLSEAKAQAAIERLLSVKLGKPGKVMLRTRVELDTLLRQNPFMKAAPNRVLVIFLDKAAPSRALDGLETPGGEEVALRGRDVYVHYPNGMGKSKLKLPLVKLGTGRNLNTVAKLVSMAQALENAT